MQITKKNFGKVDGVDVHLFTLQNDKGFEIKLSNYGGIVTSIKTPDNNGEYENIALGFDKLEDYLSKAYLESYPYFGALIGRFGNRIARGKFSLDGNDYELDINHPPNHLHGGFKGFDKTIWDAKTIDNDGIVGVSLTHLSKDGEGGYPGNLNVKVIYSLTENNECIIEYFAETDKATPINLTHHSYFNLSGERNVFDHQLQLNSEEINEVDSELIPTGKMLTVDNTPFDFRKIKALKKDFDLLENGYDNNYSLNNEEGTFIKAGELYHNGTGRLMEIFTTEVAIQLYTGKYIPTLTINDQERFGSFSGVALETQHYPDSPNHSNFPITILRPGEKYYQKTVYKFSVR